MQDLNKENTLEEIIKYTKDNQTHIILDDGKIVAYGVVYQNEEDLKRKIKMAKKYFSFTDKIKDIFSFKPKDKSKS